MMAINMKAITKIRPVGKMTLIAGIQVYGVAASLSCLVLQMLQ
jgi:hypothetical protein